MNRLTLVLVGAAGRMGRAVADVVSRTQEIEIISAIDPNAPADQSLTLAGGVDNQLVPVSPTWPVSLASNAVILDFSAPRGFRDAVDAAERFHLPLVSGTTGLTDADQESLDQLAAFVPVIHSPNMGIGVNILFHLTEKLNAILPLQFDVEVIEAHHRYKKDAPSGTAGRLIEILAGRGAPRHGRSGIIGERAANEIGVHALRLGGIIGEHRVRAASEVEEISISHRAWNRTLFVDGALLACRFASMASPARYGMRDVLGLG